MCRNVTDDVTNYELRTHRDSKLFSPLRLHRGFLLDYCFNFPVCNNSTLNNPDSAHFCKHIEHNNLVILYHCPQMAKDYRFS